MATSVLYFNGQGPSTVVYGNANDIINHTNIHHNYAQVSSKSESKAICYKLESMVSSFTGRMHELEEMRKVMQHENEQAPKSTMTVIIGVGGTGKSELARKYANQYQLYYTNIVWIDSETSGSIKSTFDTLAKMVTEESNSTGITDVYEQLSQSKSLLIFDNAEGYAIIQPFLPPFIRGNVTNIHVLLTSQIYDWDVMDEGEIYEIHLKDLLPQEAKEFVKKTLTQTNVCDEDIDNLIEKLSYFPLALTQAVAYINQQHRNIQKLHKNRCYGIDDYLVELRHQAKKLLDHKKIIHHRYEKTIFQTVKLTFEKISKEEQGETSLEIVKTMAYLAPYDIDVEKMFAGKIDAVMLLDKYSLISMKKGVASVHRLRQQVIRLLNQDNEIASLRQALSAVNKSQSIVKDNLIHALFVWSYASQHEVFVKNVTSYTYGIFKHTPLHIFAFYGYYHAADVLLAKVRPKKLNTICNYKNIHGETPLYIASDENFLDFVKLLVNKGSDVNAVNNFGESILHRASIYGNLNIIKFLIKNGSNINALDNSGATPLQRAAAANYNLDVMNFLIGNGCNVNALDKNGATLLHRAASGNYNLEVLKFLIQNGLDVNALDKNGAIPLHEAVVHDFFDIVLFLIENVSGINAKDKNGRTPLHRAVDFHRNLKIIQLLVAYGSDVNSKDDNGETPLHRAAGVNENLLIIKFLIEKGSNINALDENGVTPLHRAAEFNRNVDIIKFMIEKGSNVNAKDKNGATPLHGAANFNQNVDIIKFLIKNNSNVHAKDGKGATPLHRAADFNKNVDIIKFLIENGSHINAKENDGTTPLHRAANFNRNLNIVKFLIEKGSHVNARDNDGATPLHRAANFNRNLDITKFLIGSDSDVNAEDDDGRTPLHRAASSTDNFEIIKVLIEHGSSVNVVDKNNETPLQKASRTSSNAAAIKCLIDNGALDGKTCDFLPNLFLCCCLKLGCSFK